MSLDDGDTLRGSDKFAFFRGLNTDKSPGRRDVPINDLVDYLNDPSSGLVAGGGEGGVVWSRITANTNAETNNGYIIDSSGGAVTMILPSSPSEGDAFEFYVEDSTSTITIDRNGNNMNAVASNISLKGSDHIQVVYVDATTGYRDITSTYIGFSEVVFNSTSSSYAVPAGMTNMDILVVGGGGGGSGGAGGGGGVRNINGIAVTDANTLNIVVGAGGVGSAGGAGNNGGVSSVEIITGATYTSSGGGSGGAFQAAGATGGSGGGAGQNGANAGGAGNSGAYNPSEGNSGGGNTAVWASPYAGNGGGGHSAAGASASSSSVAGGGGDGSILFGIAVGGGGGGSASTAGTAGAGGLGGGGDGVTGIVVGTAGADNTGGGGAAGPFNPNTFSFGGAGGTGIVILRFTQ